MIKIISFCVREYELPYFKELGQKYNIDFVLNDQIITNDNYSLAFGYENIMIRGNCPLNKGSLKALKDNGLKYLLTRSVGFNHIDLEFCKEYGIEVAHVPAYSPNAIAELALTLGMMLLRNVSYTVENTKNKDFRVTNQMFSKEIRNCTVGIIGCGKIGQTTAKLFKGLGAKVLGYDVYENPNALEYLEFTNLDNLLKTSDVVSIHMPHIKGVNDCFINKEFISKMKDKAILINTARGELQNLEDLINGVKTGKLGGLGLDVIANENTLFFKKFDSKLDNPLHEEMISLYPKILVTPHIGSSTDEALVNMIEISLQNMHEYINTGKCNNSLTNK